MTSLKRFHFILSLIFMGLCLSRSPFLLAQESDLKTTTQEEKKESVYIDEKPWEVGAEGIAGNEESFKKRTELKLARSTAFCRGFMIPSRVEEWNCGPVTGASERVYCVTNFKCELVRKDFNRKTETKRLVSAIKRIDRNNKPFDIIISRAPLIDPDKFKYLSEVKQKKKFYREKQRKILQAEIEAQTRELEGEVADFDEFSNLEKKLKLDESEQIVKKKADYYADNPNLEVVETEEGKKSDYVLYREKSNNNRNEEVFRVVDRKEVERKKKLKWDTFDVGLISVSSGSAGSSLSPEIMWSPSYAINDKWNLRGFAGGHTVSGKTTETSEIETFLATDIGMLMEYFPIAGSGLYLNIGGGLQSWYSEEGGTFSTLHFGGGYLFSFKKARVIDRLYLKLANVGSEPQNTEFRFGLGINF